MTASFIATRTAALENLKAFAPSAGRAYAARRNYDMGPGAHTAVSQLSPYLRCRLITEEEVLQTVLAHHSSEAADKFIQEVFWRTYWKGWLELRPGVWDAYQQELKRNWNDLQTQGGLRARWEAACQGETKIDCFDAWAQELVETGYLHNHARMWFASIWVFTLKLPWALGADFFLRHLLDGDPASNTLGWRWVAGIQTPGKTYLARPDNIAKFTEGRFDPTGQLACEAPALAAPSPPCPRSLPPSDAYPSEVSAGLLLHEEDLSPGFVLEAFAPASTAVLAPQTRVGPLLSSPQFAEFRRTAQHDMATRWSAKLGKVQMVKDAGAVAAWAKAEGLTHVVTPYATVGPVSAALESVEAELPVSLHRLRRDFDSRAWPHATRGYFAFKKKLPELLRALPFSHGS